MFLSVIDLKFTYWDWAVLIGYLILTTWVGHRMSGKQASIKDFFLGGRTLPWWAVSGSMIATEISALTFIGVPGIVFGLQGDWTYLQWGLGSMVARFAVAYWLVPLYYEKEIYSPYDFMGNRLGAKVKTLVTGLFSLGSVLGQSVRVLVTAIILREVTAMPVELCIVVIGIVAVAWTLMGGMQTVIWTDVMQFCLFVFGGLLALFLLVRGLGWSEIVALNQVVVDGVAIDKMRFLDLTTPFENKELRYTLWVGLLAMPFQNFTAFGVDQLNTQRMFCCGLGDAAERGRRRPRSPGRRRPPRPAVADPTQRTWPPSDQDVDGALAELAHEAERLADRADGVSAADWSRAAPVAGHDVDVTALTVLWDAVDTAVTDLRAAESTLREVRGRP